MGQNFENSEAYLLLKKFDFESQIINAYHELLPQELKESQADLLIEIEQKYNQQEIRKTLLNFFQQVYSHDELKRFSSMEPESIIEDNQNKFKELENKLEEYYDQIYLDVNRALSGIKIIDIPNQSKPFEFFTINRPDGIYVATAYDDYLPQNIQIKPHPLIPAAKFISIEILRIDTFTNTIKIQLDLNDQDLIEKILQDQHADLVLIIEKKLLAIIRHEPFFQNNSLILPTEWSLNDLQMIKDTFNRGVN